MMLMGTAVPMESEKLNAVTGERLDAGNAHFPASTLALTTIDVGNPTTNVIPAEARAGFNIRFNDEHSGASLESRLRKQLDEVGGDGSDGTCLRLTRRIHASAALANIVDLRVDPGVFIPDLGIDPPAVLRFHVGTNGRAAG